MHDAEWCGRQGGALAYEYLWRKTGRLGLALERFFLSIPVFFDTVFFFLIPLAWALALRTGKHYTFYVMAMAGAGYHYPLLGAAYARSAFIAKELNIELGFAMMFGLAASILPACLVLKMASWFDRKYNLPMREASGASNEQLRRIVEKKDEELPGSFSLRFPSLFPWF